MCCIVITEGCEHVQIIIFDSFLVMRAICYLNYSKKATILHGKKITSQKMFSNLRHQFTNLCFIAKCWIIKVAAWYSNYIKLLFMSICKRWVLMVDNSPNIFF